MAEKKKIRHILGISGGKDSTALAILLYKKIPDLEFFFCDTHKELPETYEYLHRIETRLGIKIKRLGSQVGFDKWLELHGNYLPSARARWCTKKLKLEPLEQFIGNDTAYSYVGIRADENREGYFSTKNNIKPVYIYKEKKFKSRKMNKMTYNQLEITEEFKKMGIDLPIREEGYRIADVAKVLNDSGIGMPKYYSWRTRSGCFFCFFQRKYEWIGLSEKHPALFEEAAGYEKKYPNGRVFTWCEGESLKDLLKRKKQIVSEHKKKLEREKKQAPNKPLVEVLSSVLDSEDYEDPCLICTL